MQANVGRIDRVVRVVLGLALLVSMLALTTPLRWVAGLVGIVLLATGGVGYCPIYGACRISTAGPSASRSPGRS